MAVEFGDGFAEELDVYCDATPVCVLVYVCRTHNMINLPL